MKRKKNHLRDPFFFELFLWGHENHTSHKMEIRKATLTKIQKLRQMDELKLDLVAKLEKKNKMILLRQGFEKFEAYVDLLEQEASNEVKETESKE